MRQHCPTSHERRQEPGLSGRSGGAESGRRAASPCSSAPVQVPQQRRGTGPSDSEKEGLAGQGLWLLSERVANIAGYRNSGHDSEGESEVASQGRYRGPSAFHCRAIRRRCITTRVIVVHSCAPTQTVLKLRNKTKPRAATLSDEQVTVQAEAELIQTRTAAAGQLVDQKRRFGSSILKRFETF